MPGPGIDEALVEPTYQAYNVEVAVGYTGGTWEAVMTTVEDFPVWMVERAAQDKVLADYSNHPTKAVSFVTVIWMCKEPTEEDMVDLDEEEIT